MQINTNECNVGLVQVKLMRGWVKRMKSSKTHKRRQISHALELLRTNEAYGKGHHCRGSTGGCSWENESKNSLELWKVRRLLAFFTQHFCSQFRPISKLNGLLVNGHEIRGLFYLQTLLSTTTKFHTIIRPISTTKNSTVFGRTQEAYKNPPK